MLSFEVRLRDGKRAEAAFDAEAGRLGLKILRVGYEGWNGREAIDALKFMRDATSRFLRALPDRGLLTTDGLKLVDVKGTRAFNLQAYKLHKQLVEIFGLELFYVFKLDVFRVVAVSELKPDVVFCLPSHSYALRCEFDCDIAVGDKFGSAFGIVEERTWRRWPTLEEWARHLQGGRARAILKRPGVCSTRSRASIFRRGVKHERREPLEWRADGNQLPARRKRALRAG